MSEIDKAKEVLLNEGIIIYPTETVYGIGCLLKYPKSIKRLYKIKKREPTQPTSVLFPSLTSAEEYVEFSLQAKKLAERFWPGPLTMCLPSKKNLVEAVLGPDNTLGVRVPSNEWCLELLKGLNEPILAPSANFKGGQPARRFAEIDKELIQLVDYVVPIEPGGLNPSTVIGFSGDSGYNIIRPGEITEQMITETLEKGLKA
jgi:L-threonylcarbamoyladenylate synthase